MQSSAEIEFKQDLIWNSSYPIWKTFQYLTRVLLIGHLEYDEKRDSLWANIY